MKKKAMEELTPEDRIIVTKDMISVLDCPAHWEAGVPLVARILVPIWDGDYWYLWLRIDEEEVRTKVYYRRTLFEVAQEDV